jgi:hypothetical protein
MLYDVPYLDQNYTNEKVLTPRDVHGELHALVDVKRHLRFTGVNTEKSFMELYVVFIILIVVLIFHSSASDILTLETCCRFPGSFPARFERLKCRVLLWAEKLLAGQRAGLALPT